MYFSLGLKKKTRKDPGPDLMKNRISDFKKLFRDKGKNPKSHAQF